MQVYENDLAPFMEMFSNPVRMEILKRLQEKRMRMAHLARDMDIPVQEIHRNTIRLIDVGLVQKCQDSLLAITDLGIAAGIQLQSLGFMARHKQYLKEHTLLHLPSKSLQRICALNSCSTMHGIACILTKISEMYEAAGSIKVIAPQVPLDHIVTIARRVSEGVSVHYILGHNTIVPKGRASLISKVGWMEYIHKGLVKRKMVPQVNIGLVLTDQAAGLLLPHLTGEVDPNVMFYGTDKAFLQWCEELFDETWSCAELFDEGKIKEI